MTPKYIPHKGKWTTKRLIKKEIEVNGGEMFLEDLLDYMKNLGYMKEPLRNRLNFLDVEVVDGRAILRG